MADYGESRVQRIKIARAPSRRSCLGQPTTEVLARDFARQEPGCMIDDAEPHWSLYTSREAQRSTRRSGAVLSDAEERAHAERHVSRPFGRKIRPNERHKRVARLSLSGSTLE